MGGMTSESSDLYGVLDRRNIGKVSFGPYEFDTWYGNAAFFAPESKKLGIQTHDLAGGSFKSSTDKFPNGINSDIGGNRLIQDDSEITNTTGTQVKEAGNPIQSSDGFWLSKLYVCDYCFKYSDDENALMIHRDQCVYNREVPNIGTLKYLDLQTNYIIIQVKGYQHELFVQNLCLFGKLFLDNKSVYYNVVHFDVYIVYGKDPNNDEVSHYKPMGFFSKEVTAWDSDNNLACICVFPPFQRKGLGSLLIEFSYELAAITPGQQFSGPEFPLSKFGQISYLRFWSKTLAKVLQSRIEQANKQQHYKKNYKGNTNINNNNNKDYNANGNGNKKSNNIHNKPSNPIKYNGKKKHKFTLLSLAKETGFRKEDILMTLQYMGLLYENINNSVYCYSGTLYDWIDKNNPNVTKVLKSECLVL